MFNHKIESNISQEFKLSTAEYLTISHNDNDVHETVREKLLNSHYQLKK